MPRMQPMCRRQNALALNVVSEIQMTLGSVRNAVTSWEQPNATSVGQSWPPVPVSVAPVVLNRRYNLG